MGPGRTDRPGPENIMVRVRVVTDSTADMDEAEASALGISIVPLNVHWNGDTYLDKVELSTDDFYRKLKEEKGTPRTSQPSVGQFEDVYRRLLRESDSILSVHISSKLSGTLNSAAIAAKQVVSDRIKVVDSLTTTYPLGVIALRTARAARDGAGLAECEELARRLIPRVKLVAAVDTLEYLRRGGRIGRAQAFAGTLLSIKLVFHLEGGVVEPVDRVRTRTATIKRTAEFAAQLGDVEEMAVLYGDNPQPALELAHLLSSARPGIQFGLGRIGPVLGAHTGPGVYGVGLVLPE